MVELALPKNSTITEGKKYPAPAGAKHTKTFKIYRWSPDDDANPRVDEYTIDLDACGPMVLDAIITRTNLGDLRPHIEVERVITPADWDAGGVYQGATFNLAHSMNQMLYFRPHNKFEELDRCYLVGGGTHPGSGLPTIYQSGMIAAHLIGKKYGQ